MSSRVRVGAGRRRLTALIALPGVIPAAALPREPLPGGGTIGPAPPVSLTVQRAGAVGLQGGRGRRSGIGIGVVLVALLVHPREVGSGV